MRFSFEDIQRFATWSADRNPLHVDAEYASATYFGQPIAHGMLSVIGALAHANGVAFDGPLAVDIEFKGAVRPDEIYDVECVPDDAGVRVAVRSADAVVLSIHLQGAEVPSAQNAVHHAVGDGPALRTTPAERSDADFEVPLELRGSYTTGDVPGTYLAADGLRPVQARVLALCSYLVGMELPGLRSLFMKASLKFAPSQADVRSLAYRLRTTRFDRQFRILESAVEIAGPDGALVAAGTLRSYVPFAVSGADADELAARLSAAATTYRGAVALVVGGTRGLGADLSTALASAGCRVFASFHRDRLAASRLEQRLARNGLQVTLVHGDAGDSDWCEATLEQIRRECGRLDLLVLNACAPPVVLPIARRAVERSARYVSDNLRLVQSPLAVCLPAVQESGGAVVYVSSSFVEETPAGFGAYVAVKQAGEGLLRAASRESGFDALIVRPPRLQTRWNDTPAGAIGTIPADRVASHVVNRLAEIRGSKRVEVLSSFPAFERVGQAQPGGSDGPAKAGHYDPSAIRLAVAGTFTLDPLLPALRFWLDELRISGEIDVAPYGQVIQTLLDPAGVFASAGRGLNVVLLRVADWTRELADASSSSPEDLRAHIERAVSDLGRAMRAHRSKGGRPTLLMLCPSPATGAPEIDAPVARAERDVASTLAGIGGLHVLDARTLHDRYGVGDTGIHDPLRDRIGHIPYRDEYFHVLATGVVRHAFRRLSAPRKVVVVDADNTLWRGVVGEVGADGVVFDEGHRALHRTLVRLSSSGVVIAICSKNEEDDVWEVFETRRDMELRREHIVAAAINWQSKSQNIRALASRLNLGVDSFVFIDDNPVECAEVRAHCPDVLTLEWPQDPEAAARLLEHTWELDVLDVTAEDTRRTEMYREELQRRELREGTLTLSEFLDSLDLQIDVAPLAADDLRRASQLTLRTNQFNFTTRRRDEAEMQSLAAGGQHEIRTVRVRDRFGDYGLVGLLIAGWSDGLLDLDTFLLSCRVLGRGVEHRMAAELGRIAEARGVGAVRLHIDFTKKNTPARQFLQAIAPAYLLSTTESALDCRLSARQLADLQFQPSDGDAGPDQAGEEEPPRGAPSDSGNLRARERQIVRSATELGNVRGLTALIALRDSSTVPPVVSAFRRTRRPAEAGHYENPNALSGSGEAEVSDRVHAAFAAALRIPATRVAEVDRLEALGCDSLKIVEITVDLSEAFPWIPPTLLFEHRTVSEIVRATAKLRGSADPAHRGEHHGTTRQLVTNREPAASHDIAVVGMNVRCAGASSPSELWELLSTGRSAVKSVPADRRHFLRPLVDTREHWAGLLDDVARFDAEFFGVSPREAEYMDPQLRLFLEVAWGALEDAGCVGADHDPDTGVFAGVMYGDYGARANVGSTGAASPYRCWEGFSLANRLSQLLGFGGPSLAVDTACSSSGTALHLACTALKARECRVAVVGGVNLILDPDRFASLGRLGILSARGRCEPFGADADGTALGEGAGVVVLRRLDDALQRGDRIYGVIKGTGLSTGSGTVGFTAPNPQAQADAIRRSLKAAGVDPRTISYVETHGTGTALGDPIEVRGLTLAYETPELRDDSLLIEPRCRLGSIKPNIGHLEAGAGVLGLVKVLLQLQHRMLVPSITSDQPNPQIRFAQSPFDVQRVLAPWPHPSASVNGQELTLPRRAGLSSFGVGGANAHVIVEEPPPQVDGAAPPLADRPVHLLALSGRTETALRRQAERLLHAVENDPNVSIGDLCFTVSTRRRHFEHRAAAAVGDPAGMRSVLGDIAVAAESARIARGHASSSAAPRMAFLFTGQGSQYAGMGRQLYETHPVFRDAIDRCAGILDRMLTRPLRDVMFAAGDEVDAELVNQTGYTQPALFAFEYAMSCLWQSWGVKPDVVIGHSVGELAAMCVAGGMTLEDAVILVASRGRLMQALPPGGVMVSVTADETRVRAAIDRYRDVVSIAAINAPGQIVISGAAAAVDEIVATLTAEGVRSKALTVSHAFHSPLMAPMLADYRRVLERIAFRQPTVRFVSGVDASLPGEQLADAEYWIRNVTDPVRFVDAVRMLETEKVDICLEVGPHPVLLGMARQSAADDGACEWLPSIRRDAEPWEALLGSVARLYVRGMPIDWKGFDAPYARARVPVPTYAFAGKEYWLKTAERPRTLALYEMAWRRAELEPSLDRSLHWVILADEGGVGVELADALHARGVKTTLVTSGERFESTGTRSYVINPASPGDLERLWNAVAADDPEGARVVQLWNLDAPSGDSLDRDALDHAMERGVSQTVGLVQTLAAAGVAHPALWIVTQGAVAVDSASTDLANRPSQRTGGQLATAQAAAWGLGRTIALEHPEFWGGLIDIPSRDHREAARLLARELTGVPVDDQVALTDDDRYVARLAPSSGAMSTSSPLTIRNDGAYLVTGGQGALGLHVARWLVRAGARHLVLVGRRGVLDGPARAAIELLERAGAQVSVVPGDVSNPADVDTILATIANGPARLRGIFHLAGVDSVIPISALRAGDVERALAAKVRGGWLLHERTRSASLDLFVCFSSLASVLGSQGRAPYAAANAFLDALAVERQRLGLPGVSISWGPWKDGGMASGAHLQQFERIGNRGLDPGQAVHVLETVLRAGLSHAVVADIDWQRFRPLYEARRAKPVLSEIQAWTSLLPLEVSRAESTHADGSDSRAEARSVAPQLEASVKPAKHGVDDWSELIRNIPAARREGELARLLQREVAETLGFDSPDGVGLDRNFYEIGMDSLMMADLVGRLKRRVGFSCSALVFDHPDVRSLARRLIERLPLQSTDAEIAPRNAASGETSHADPVPLTARHSAGEGGSGAAPEWPAPHVSAAAASVAVLDVPVVEKQVTGYDAVAEPEIFAFQEEAFPQRNPRLIPARWRWMFVESARRLAREPRVWLYREAGAVVGHMGSIPVRLKLGAEEHDTGWLVDTMVLPAYRNQATGSRLMVEAHDDQPFSLSLGQTTEMREIQFRLGWTQVAPLQTAQLLVRPANVLKGKLPGPAAYAASLGFRASATLRDLLSERRHYVARAIDRFGEQHDRLWSAMSRDVACAVVRDASYLNWKYVDQPGQQFLRLELRDGDTLKAIAVWMFREPDDVYRYRRAFLVDVVAPIGDGSTLRHAIRAACAAATAEGADALLCYHTDARLTDALRDCNFHLRKPERFLLVDAASLPAQARDLALSGTHWFVTQGDSDIDRPW